MTSVYSASVSSSKHSGLKRRTQTHVQPPVSEIRQRVLSARMLRFRTMQNQLTLSQHQIHVRLLFIIFSITSFHFYTLFTTSPTGPGTGEQKPQNDNSSPRKGVGQVRQRECRTSPPAEESPGRDSNLERKVESVA